MTKRKERELRPLNRGEVSLAQVRIGMMPVSQLQARETAYEMHGLLERLLAQVSAQMDELDDLRLEEGRASELAEECARLGSAAYAANESLRALREFRDMVRLEHPAEYARLLASFPPIPRVLVDVGRE